MPFRVALRGAAWRGAHHRQIASVIECILHARGEQCILESAAPHVRDRGRAGKQRDSIVNRHVVGCAGLPIDFREKAEWIGARCVDAA